VLGVGQTYCQCRWFDISQSYDQGALELDECSFFKNAVSGNGFGLPATFIAA
jgi:hypothetical protein